MGLAGIKTKIKIGTDPRNTTWSNDHSRFGQKHLKQMGWIPGQGLGTGSSGRQAMTSHVKVAIKKDNSGLGKKSAAANGGVMDGEIITGLDVFQKILGKLNGKDEGLVEMQLMDQRKRAVLSSKYGMEFVYGGVLKGSLDGDEERKEEQEIGDQKKKRKRSEGDGQGEEESIAKRVHKEVDQREEEKREEKREESKENESKEKERVGKKEKKKDKKDKAKKDKAKKDKAKKDKVKKDKWEKEKVKKGKKEKKEKEKEVKESEESKEKKEEKDKKDKKKSEKDIQIASPASTGASTPNGRLLSRAKWIQQKRASTMDLKSLNEIFMVRQDA